MIQESQVISSDLIILTLFVHVVNVGIRGLYIINKVFTSTSYYTYIYIYINDEYLFNYQELYWLL